MNRIQRVPSSAVAVVVTAVVVLPVLVEPVRLLYAVVFCLLVPGAGWAYRSGVGDAGDRVALAVVISMSATICVSTAMAVTGTWSVTSGVAALAAIAVLGWVPYRPVGRTTPSHAGPGRESRRGPDAGD